MKNKSGRGADSWVKRPLRGCAPVLLASLGVSFTSSAGAMSIRELRALEQSDKDHGDIYVQYYLVGAMEGALEANAQAVRNAARPLFCLDGRRLEPRMAKPMFDAELKRNAGLYEADMPTQLVLLNALSTSYTCR